MSYIEREALIAEFKRLTLGEGSLIERFFADGVYAVLETFPTIDAQKVVRCKDCVFFQKDTFGQSVCARSFNQFCMNSDDFCSYGERKCDNGNG